MLVPRARPEDNEISAIATPSGSLSVDVNTAGNYLEMPMRATTGPHAGDIREATIVYDAWHNPIEVQDVLHNDVEYIYDTRGRLLAFFETNSPTTNPFGSRQLVWDGNRVIKELVLGEIEKVLDQPLFELHGDEGEPESTGRWIAAAMNPTPLNDPESHLEQVKAWGHSLEWYAHDGNLDGDLDTHRNVVPELFDDNPTLPVDVSAFVDHGILGQPRITFAADAWLDGENNPMQTSVYEAVDPSQVAPTQEWEVVHGSAVTEDRLTRPLEYYTQGFNGEFNAFPAADEDGDGHCNWPYILTLNRNSIPLYYQGLGYTSQVSESSFAQARGARQGNDWSPDNLWGEDHHRPIRDQVDVSAGTQRRLSGVANILQTMAQLLLIWEHGPELHGDLLQNGRRCCLESFNYPIVRESGTFAGMVDWARLPEGGGNGRHRTVGTILTFEATATFGTGDGCDPNCCEFRQLVKGFRRIYDTETDTVVDTTLDTNGRWAIDAAPNPGGPHDTYGGSWTDSSGQEYDNERAYDRYSECRTRYRMVDQPTHIISPTSMSQRAEGTVEFMGLILDVCEGGILDYGYLKHTYEVGWLQQSSSVEYVRSARWR